MNKSFLKAGALLGALTIIFGAFAAHAIKSRVNAETLAIFGWVGFCVRIFIELSLFFYTKVWKNYYRLLLFLFIFLYQFTGSFITNIAEYVIWIMAFTNAFPQFDVKIFYRRPVMQLQITQ